MMEPRRFPSKTSTTSGAETGRFGDGIMAGKTGMDALRNGGARR